MIDAHPLQLIDAAAFGGFSHCGIRLVAPRPGDPLIDVLAEKGAIKAIGRTLKDAGIKLLDIEAIWLGPDTDVQSLRTALDAGAELGARFVLVVGNDENKQRLQANLASLCKLAEQFGLKVMLEFITYCSIDSLGSAARMVDAVKADNFGLLIDTLQFFRSGASPEDVSTYDPSLFSYIQICDGRSKAPTSLDERRREARQDRLLPGEGELPVKDLLNALPSGIPISLEAPTARLRGLKYREQGRIAGEALRSFLAKSNDPRHDHRS
jgi:sugar phosphate isomerase/epimerase